MLTPAQEIAAGLAEIREELGVAVTYVRKGGNSIPISNAVLTKPVAKSATAQGSARREQAQDWLIASADLVDGETPFRPNKDDVITHDDGTTTTHYEVQPFNGRGDSELEESDHSVTPSQFRIHTKVKKRATNP